MARRVVWCQRSSQGVIDEAEGQRWRTVATDHLSTNFMTAAQFVEKCSHTPQDINDVAFLGTAAVYQDYLMFVEALTSLPSLRRFALVDAHPKMFQFGTSSKLLKNVTDVMIRSCQLSEIPMNIFTAMGHRLHSVDLSNNSLTDLSPISHLLHECQNLLHVDIGRNQLLEFPQAIAGLSALVHLNISHNRLSRINEDDIYQLLALKYLDISNNIDITEVTAELPELPNLNHLHLVGLGALEIPPYVCAKNGLEAIKKYFTDKAKKGWLGRDSFRRSKKRRNG